MKILIGYSMRSGSTLLQHILNGHSAIRSFSDLSSSLVLPRILLGAAPGGNVCIKPMDLLFLQRRLDFYPKFDRFIWLTRDPRDSYLSSIESGYAYWFWRRGKMEEGIDTGLLARWRRIHRHYFDNRQRWKLVRYEDLVRQPETTVAAILDYLQLPHERLFPFDDFSMVHGGDYKLARSNTVCSRSSRRFERSLGPAQIALFEQQLGEEMAELGYLEGAASPGNEHQPERPVRAA